MKSDTGQPAGAVPCLISAAQIHQRVADLARQISADYAGREPLVVGVLKGAWIFMADLVRQLTVPITCDFVKLSSYGGATHTTGEVCLHLDLSIPIQGKDVLVVEDVIDTGTCIGWLVDHLWAKGPASVRICALLDNPARRVRSTPIDYLGFTIPDCFVVGYGIDCGERYRELPYVGFVSREEEGSA